MRMDENQINTFLRHILRKKKLTPSNYFRGCFSIDEILNNRKLFPHLEKKNETFAFVLHNTRRHENKFGHWLAIQIRVSGGVIKLIFFDSFAISHKSYGEFLINYVNHIRLYCFENGFKYHFDSLDKPIQHPYSLTCGAHVCYFIAKCINSSIKTQYNKFEKHDKKKNDEIVMKFIRINWPTNYCNTPTPSKSMLHRKNHFCPIKAYGDSSCLKTCKCCSNNDAAITSSDDELNVG